MRKKDKVKKRTLRFQKENIPSKRTYLLQNAGNLTDLEKERYYTQYAKQLETKKELFETIQNEGSHLFDSENAKKIETYKPKITDFLNSIQYNEDTSSLELLSSLESTIESQTEKRLSLIQSFGNSYSSYYNMILKTQESIMNQLKDENEFIKRLLQKFKMNQIHIHFLEIYYNILIQRKDSISQIEKQLLDINQKIDSINSFIVDDYQENEKHRQALQFRLKEREAELDSAISTVLATPPPTIKPNETFIQGCPYGSYLENDSCYYLDLSNNRIGDSVTYQKDLVSNSSDIVVWFQNPLARPILFERKAKKYVIELSQNDKNYFEANYVEVEQNGALKQDRFGNYLFFTNLDCCYNDTIPQILKMNAPANNFEYYYLTDDGTPQPVEIVQGTAQQIYTNESAQKYIKICSDEDQITLGIQYIETDADGKFSSIIPFFPDLLQFKIDTKSSTFTKKASNGVDTITYTILKEQLTDSILSNLDVTMRPKKLQLNYSNLNIHNSNILDDSYLNGILEMNLPTLYKPFVLPFVLQNEGDYIVIHNSSDSVPVILELSKDSKEKRVVVYPHQYYVFIFSKTSTILNYGFLHLAINPDVSYRSTKVGVVNDTYIFTDGKQPLRDTENLLIPVPNFHNDSSTYFEYDDVFENTPLKVTVQSDSISVENPIFSMFHKAYKSNTICKMDTVFIFCDTSGNPNLDIFGYVVPIPSKLETDNNTYSWDRNTVTVAKPYDGNATIDLNYPITQSGGEQSGGGDVSDTYRKSLLDKLSIYQQTIQTLIDKYKSVTTSINNFSDLSVQLSNIIFNLPKQNDSQSVDTMFQKGETIYNQALKTKDSIETVLQQETQQKIIQDNVDQRREKYSTQLAQVLQNEASIQTEISKSEESINSLDENINSTQLKSDLEEIKTLFNQAQQSRMMLNTSVSNSNDADFLQSQESAILTVLNSQKSIESYNTNLQNAIEKAKADYNSMLIQSNQAMLTQYKNTILEESSNLDTLKNYYNSTLQSIDTKLLTPQIQDVYDSTKKQIELEISNIQNIVDDVNKPIPTVMTDDAITSLSSKYISYIREVQNEKVKLQNNIQQLQDISNKTFESAVSTKKQNLSDFINALNQKKQKILDLSGNLSASYITELQTVQSNISASSDLNDLNAYENQLTVLDGEFDKILIETQTKEFLNRAPSPQSGGRKNNTRRLPKNLVVRN